MAKISVADFEKATLDLAEYIGEEIELSGSNEKKVQTFVDIITEKIIPDSKLEEGLPEHIADIFNALTDEKGGGVGAIAFPIPKPKVLAKAPSKLKPVASKKAPTLPAKASVKAPVKTALKEVEKKEPALKKESKPVEKSRYGHRVETGAQIMDDLLWAGCTVAEAVSALKKFGKTEDRAKSMFLSHVHYLPKTKNIPVTIPKDEGGKYKATKAKIDI